MINKKNIVGILFILIGVLYLGSAIITQNAYGLSANTSGEPIDVIGSKSGTTTTGVVFPGKFTATTTAVVGIGQNTDTATFTFKTVNASSTPSGEVSFTILASNDYYCDTATTTTIYSYIPEDNMINWYDVGTYAINGSQTVAIPVATTTFSWFPTGAWQNKSITLTNLNSKCLALQVNASSTELFVQLVTKGKGY